MTDDQQDRFRFLISRCLIQDGGTLNYDTVVAKKYEEFCTDLSKHARRKQYRSDCVSLVDYFNSVRGSILEPFFLPLPELEFVSKASQLQIKTGRRPVIVDKNKISNEKIKDRINLVEFALSCRISSESDVQIIPRTGRIYAGFGTTTCFVFRELLTKFDKHNPIKDLVVYTASIEIMGLMYYLHEQHSGNEAIRIATAQYIDRNLGMFRPNIEDHAKVDTAVISYNGMKDGELYSSAPEDYRQSVTAYIENAKNVVIVMDDWKIGFAGLGFDVQLPSKTCKNTPIYIVTNAQEAQVRHHMPKSLEHVQIFSSATEKS